MALTGPGFDSRHLHKDNDPGLIPWVVVFVWHLGVGNREEGVRSATAPDAGGQGYGLLNFPLHLENPPPYGMWVRTVGVMSDRELVLPRV